MAPREKIVQWIVVRSGRCVSFKPPFNSLEETMCGVFNKHPGPRKIVIIGPRNTSAGQRGNRGLWYANPRMMSDVGRAGGDIDDASGR